MNRELLLLCVVFSGLRARIWRGYFAIAFRIAPQWHREDENRMAVDHTPGVASSGLVESSVTSSGFDLSGLDVWTAGTLATSWFFRPRTPQVLSHFESARVRFDNLLGSRWLNPKFGKHELDTPILEKRCLALTNGGLFR